MNPTCSMHARAAPARQWALGLSLTLRQREMFLSRSGVFSAEVQPELLVSKQRQDGSRAHLSVPVFSPWMPVTVTCMSCLTRSYYEITTFPMDNVIIPSSDTGDSYWLDLKLLNKFTWWLKLLICNCYKLNFNEISCRPGKWWQQKVSNS